VSSTSGLPRAGEPVAHDAGEHGRAGADEQKNGRDKDAERDEIPLGAFERRLALRLVSPVVPSRRHDEACPFLSSPIRIFSHSA